ncbi:MAG: ABC transporter ATP-binding protein [Pseudohongiellaceae bacterium]
MQALSVTGLSKNYGSFSVLADLNLQVEKGSIHGLVGLNGSGKTTTIECILGLQGFDSGDITALGYAPGKLHLSKGKLVAVFDSPSLHPNLTVRQALEHAVLLCESPTRSPANVEELLGIARFSNFKIKNLSLGNKRRASIAQALLGDPEFVVLDEPFNGLDAGGVDDVLALIGFLNSEHGTTFLLSSHQLPYLEQVCSHIAILHKGKISQSDTINNLLGNTQTTIQIRSSEIEAARRLLDSISGVEPTGIDTDGYLNVAISNSDSAAINRALVEHNIPVEELLLKRASLAGLFRQVTSEGAP